MQQVPAKDEAQLPIPNVEELSRNMAALVEEAGKATAAYLRPLEEQRANTGLADKAADYVKTLGQVAEYWLVDPQKAIEAQTRLGSTFLDLWSTTLKRMQGEAAAPVAAPDPKDSRFKDPEWSQNPVFDFLKQAYLITSRWAETLVQEAEGLDEHTRHKAEFYVRQLSSALSPSNFLATNPELIRDDDPGERRQSRARHEDARRGHRGRPAASSRCASRTRSASRSGSTWRTRRARSCSATISSSSSSTRRRPRRCCAARS